MLTSSRSPGLRATNVVTVCGALDPGRSLKIPPEPCTASCSQDIRSPEREMELGMEMPQLPAFWSWPCWCTQGIKLCSRRSRDDAEVLRPPSALATCRHSSAWIIDARKFQHRPCERCPELSHCGPKTAGTIVFDDTTVRNAIHGSKGTTLGAAGLRAKPRNLTIKGNLPPGVMQAEY